MARSLTPSRRVLGAGLVALLAAGGCYFDKFEKVQTLSAGSGGSGSGGENMGGTGNAGGETGTGGNGMTIMEARAVDDEFFIVQGEELLEDVLTNDGGPDVRVTASDDSAPNRPSSLDATFSLSDIGVLRFTPHPDFWGTYRITYEIEDENGETSSGNIVIHVRPETIRVATIAAGWGGVIIDGDTADLLGTSLAGLRDFNGDGNADFALGAPGPEGATSTGRVAIVYGGANLSDLDLAATNDNVQFYNGDGTTHRAGLSVSWAGNINEDLFQDVIIGATDIGQDGRAYIVYGSGGPAGMARVLKDNPNVLEGFTLRGDSNNRTGRTVAGGGDINGDGVDDVVVFSNENDPSEVGSAGTYSAVFQEQNELLTNARDLSFNSRRTFGSQSSPGCAFLGDLFGSDNKGEVLLTSRNPGGGTLVNLLIGKDGTDAGNQWPADPTYTESADEGWKSAAFADAPTDPPSVASAGAFDGQDGDDLAYCDQDADCTIVSSAGATTFDLKAGRTVTGFTGSPRLVAGGGNLNGDGRDDLVFAEPTRAYVLWGVDNPPTEALDVTDPGAEGFSVDPDGETISQIAILGDVNDDGLDDFAIAMPAFDGGKGRVVVIFGVDAD